MIDALVLLAPLLLLLIVCGFGMTGCIIDRSARPIPFPAEVPLVVSFHPPTLDASLPGMSPASGYHVRVEVWAFDEHVGSIWTEDPGERLPGDWIPDDWITYRLLWRMVFPRAFVPGGTLDFNFICEVYGIHDPGPRVLVARGGGPACHILPETSSHPWQVRFYHSHTDLASGLGYLACVVSEVLP